MRERLNAYVGSHMVDPLLLRSDSFDRFMLDRQNRLLALIEQAMGKAAYKGADPEEGEDVEIEGDAAEAQLTIHA